MNEHNSKNLIVGQESLYSEMLSEPTLMTMKKAFKYHGHEFLVLFANLLLDFGEKNKLQVLLL